jgi:hypothetical protein
MSLNRSVVGRLAALVIVLSSTACGATAPASVAAPTTLKQLQARLVTTADLPDGIRAFTDRQTQPFLPGQSPQAWPVNCHDLYLGSALFGYRPAPALSAKADLIRNVNSALSLHWDGQEALFAYRPGQAGQVLADMAASVDRCAAGSVPVTNASGNFVIRVRESRHAGLGDEAIDIQIRTTFHDKKQTLPGGLTMPARTGIISSDAVAIRSGDCLLVVWEMGNPVSWNKYLTDATAAAWRAFREHR